MNSESVGVLFRYPQGRAVLRPAVIDGAQGRVDHHRYPLRRDPEMAGAGISFHCDEAWSMYRPDAAPSVHLLSFPDELQAFRDDALAAKWQTIRDVRRVVTGALELERAAKRIGSSLEASPVIYVSDRQTLATLFDVDLAEVCITSNYEVREGEAPAGAFRLNDVPNVAVVVEKAVGKKVRPVVEDPPHRRRGCRISRRVAAGRHCIARMEGDGSDALSLHLRYGVIVAAATLCARSGFQVLAGPSVRHRPPRHRQAHPVLRSGPGLESGHQLRLVSERWSDGPDRPDGDQGGGGRSPGDLDGPVAHR